MCINKNNRWYERTDRIAWRVRDGTYVVRSGPGLHIERVLGGGKYSRVIELVRYVETPPVF